MVVWTSSHVPTALSVVRVVEPVEFTEERFTVLTTSSDEFLTLIAASAVNAGVEEVNETSVFDWTDFSLPESVTSAILILWLAAETA